MTQPPQEPFSPQENGLPQQQPSMPAQQAMPPVPPQGAPYLPPPTPPQTQKKTGLVTAGLVLGIIGVLAALTPVVGAPAGILFGVLALIFGIVGINRKLGGKALASTILGAVAIVLAIVMSVVVYNVVQKNAPQIIASAKASAAAAAAPGDQTQQLLKTDVNVTIGAFTATDQGYGDFDTSLPVTVKNIGNSTADYYITIAAENPDGSQIDTDEVSIDALAPGQSAQKTAFDLASSSQVPALKAGTFKVVKVEKY